MIPCIACEVKNVEIEKLRELLGEAIDKIDFRPTTPDETAAEKYLIKRIDAALGEK